MRGWHTFRGFRKVGFDAVPGERILTLAQPANANAPRLVRHAWTLRDREGNEFHPCRIGPARVGRTLLSAAFDFDFARCTHGPLPGRGRAALQRRVQAPHKNSASAAESSLSPRNWWMTRRSPCLAENVRRLPPPFSSALTVHSSPQSTLDRAKLSKLPRAQARRFAP
jgi:hypothetical protein